MPRPEPGLLPRVVPEASGEQPRHNDDALRETERERVDCGWPKGGRRRGRFLNTPGKVPQPSPQRFLKTAAGVTHSPGGAGGWPGVLRVGFLKQIEALRSDFGPVKDWPSELSLLLSL